MSGKQMPIPKRRKRRLRRKKTDEERADHRPPSPGADVSGLSVLQQRVGNRAVQRMLLQREEKTQEDKARAEEAKKPKPIPAHFFSGPHWFKLFPPSNELRDLMPGFRLRVQRFIDAIEDAEGEVEILSTKHSPALAYLMHWAWRIAKEDYDPQRVPAMDGVPIHWWHGDALLSREVAQAMVEACGIDHLEVAPPLESQHVQGNAVDMHIVWEGNLDIEDAQYNKFLIVGSPTDGTNKDLIAVAKTYGVIHFPYVNKDPFHWSTDGK